MKRKAGSHTLKSLPSRRRFLHAGLRVAASVATYFSIPAFAQSRRKSREPFFKTRGVVLTTPDLSTLDWPQRAARAELTTIATHVTPSEVSKFIQSDRGRGFIGQCRKMGIEVEYELHAMSDLLPRELFEKDPLMFRMNEKGERSIDFNCCVHSSNAIEIICRNAVEYANILKPTTSRYFYWVDDGKPMCKCSRCRIYTDSEQALILENEMLKALRRVDSQATLAHLADAETYLENRRQKGFNTVNVMLVATDLEIARNWKPGSLKDDGRRSGTEKGFRK